LNFKILKILKIQIYILKKKKIQKNTNTPKKIKKYKKIQELKKGGIQIQHQKEKIHVLV